MKKIIFLFNTALLVIVSATSSTTFAGKIYKWTDDDGKVHYGERPNGGNAKQISVPRSAPHNTAPAPQSTNKNDTAKKFLEGVAAERKEKNEASEKAAKEKEIADKNCSIARRQAAGLKLGGRQFEVDEKGERNYLDEAAIQTRLDEALKNVEKWCK
jgi:hypothetical protein